VTVPSDRDPVAKSSPYHQPAEDLTVQYQVPKELLEQLAAADGAGKTRVGLVFDEEERTLLMLPAEAKQALNRVPSAPPAPPPPPAVLFTDADLRALHRPRRVARNVALTLLALGAAGIIALSLASS
jgi:hypothetical protein